MSELFLIPLDSHPKANLRANVTVLCGGNVRTSGGTGLHRRVVAFLDNNLGTVLGETESTESNGLFSMALPGFPTTRYTVIAIGSTGEQSVIYSQCREF